MQPTIFVGFGHSGEQILGVLKERLARESDGAVPPSIFDFLSVDSIESFPSQCRQSLKSVTAFHLDAPITSHIEVYVIGDFNDFIDLFSLPEIVIKEAAKRHLDVVLRSVFFLPVEEYDEEVKGQQREHARCAWQKLKSQMNAPSRPFETCFFVDSIDEYNQTLGAEQQNELTVEFLALATASLLRDAIHEAQRKHALATFEQRCSSFGIREYVYSLQEAKSRLLYQLDKEVTQRLLSEPLPTRDTKAKMKRTQTLSDNLKAILDEESDVNEQTHNNLLETLKQFVEVQFAEVQGGLASFQLRLDNARSGLRRAIALLHDEKRSIEREIVKLRAQIRFPKSAEYETKVTLQPRSWQKGRAIAVAAIFALVLSALFQTIPVRLTFSFFVLVGLVLLFWWVKPLEQRETIVKGEPQVPEELKEKLKAAELQRQQLLAQCDAIEQLFEYLDELAYRTKRFHENIKQHQTTLESESGDTLYRELTACFTCNVAEASEIEEAFIAQVGDIQQCASDFLAEGLFRLLDGKNFETLVEEFGRQRFAEMQIRSPEKVLADTLNGGQPFLFDIATLWREQNAQAKVFIVGVENTETSPLAGKLNGIHSFVSINSPKVIVLALSSGIDIEESLVCD